MTKSSPTYPQISAPSNGHAEPPSDQNSSSPEVDSDALLDALETEDDSDFRAARLKQLTAELSAIKATTHPASSEQAYRVLKSDQDVLDFTTKSDKSVVHFSHPDFGRCAVMDGHLKGLSGLHGEAEFGKADVRECEFVVEKLGVRVLPCVIGFVNGQVKGRVTGFEGLMVGGEEKGERVSRQLEKVLLGMGVLDRCEMDEEEDENDEESDGRVGLDGRKGLRGRIEKAYDDEDEDDDWD